MLRHVTVESPLDERALATLNPNDVEPADSHRKAPTALYAFAIFVSLAKEVRKTRKNS